MANRPSGQGEFHSSFARTPMMQSSASSSSLGNYSVLSDGMAAGIGTPSTGQSSSVVGSSRYPPSQGSRTYQDGDAKEESSAKRRRVFHDSGSPASSQLPQLHRRGGSDTEFRQGSSSLSSPGNNDQAAASQQLRDSPADNGSSNRNGESDQSSAAHSGKRMKTARACDSCRRKKIRCDVIDDGSPPTGDPNNGNGGLTCAHCRQYGFNCTFFLPITETRFKKKREREAEEAAAAAASRAGMGPHGQRGFYGAPPGMPFPHGTFQTELPVPQHRVHNAAQEWPPPNWSSHVGPHPHPPPPPPQHLQRLQARWDEGEGRRQPMSPKSGSAPGLAAGAPERLNRLPPPSAPPPSGPPPGHDGGVPPPDTRVLGPTSLAYIVHSTAFVPGSAIEAHDLKHSQTFEVGASGDGIIKLNRSRQRNQSVASSEDGEEPKAQIPDSIRGRLAGDVAEKLVNSYFEKLGYLWPVVTKSEFLYLTQPPPLLLYAMCGVAALDRNVPREVLSAVRIGLNSLFRDNDILSSSNALTVRALLILSLHGDVHGSSNVQSGTRLWNRLGVALRMAQDLGLHRDASRKDDSSHFAHFLEQKRRIWGACVTADRIISVALGHPLAIDLTDCDVRLPSPYEILRFPNDLPSLPGNERPFTFNTEMLKLSILFGRVQKTIYSPTGLMKATDEEISGLLSDIDQWKESLPEEVQYKGPNSPPVAGILHLAHACIQMLFFRVFMRISYSCPKHLNFSLTIERMNNLISWSRESIDWIDASGAFYVDTMQFVTYALVFCATVQYHAWIRRSDRQGLEYLEKLKEAVRKGGRPPPSGKTDLSLQAKAAEIISLLCEAAQGQWANTPFTGNLNPTAGVENRRTTESVQGIVWKKNVSARPGAPGGVYEVLDASLMLSDLPKGTVILGRNRAPALVRTESNDWRPVPGVIPDYTPTPAGGQGAPQGDGSGGTGRTAASNSLNPGMNGGSEEEGDLPDLSNMTYLGGSVWQDESGRPVDRRGSDLMVVLPGGAQWFGGGGSAGGGVGSGDPDLSALIGADSTDPGVLAALGQGTNAPSNNVNPELNGINNTASSRYTPAGAPLLGNLDSSSQSIANNATFPPSNGAMGGPGSGNALHDPFASASSSSTNAAGANNLNMFSGGADPLMLNDPMMGILDWQAWQSYLAPFSSNGGAGGVSSGGVNGNDASGTGAGAGTMVDGENSDEDNNDRSHNNP